MSLFFYISVFGLYGAMMCDLLVLLLSNGLYILCLAEICVRVVAAASLQQYSGQQRKEGRMDKASGEWKWFYPAWKQVFLYLLVNIHKLLVINFCVIGPNLVTKS